MISANVGSFAMYAPHVSTQIGFYSAAGWALYANPNSINATCPGTFTAVTKLFDIQHPDPAKPGLRLRHWCVESDAPGGLVLYRRTIDMNATTATFEMPDWFTHLTKDAIVMATPSGHFGSAYGDCNGNTVEIHATTLGKWHVLITASRNDMCATTMCPQDVEYTPSMGEARPEPPPPPPPFPQV